MTLHYFAQFMLGVLGYVAWFYIGRWSQRRETKRNATKVTGTVAGYVACPDCDEVVPMGLKPIRLEQQDGQQVAVAEVDLSDVWAHAWTHSEATT